MPTHPTPRTADDVLDLPLPDGVSGYEFVNGRPVPVMSASGTHGRLMGEVYYRIRTYLETTGTPGLAYVDVGFVLGLRADPERTRGPDVAFVTESRLRDHGEPFGKFLRFVPDLAIEIEMAGRKPHRRQRILDYLDAGTPLVWAIHPRTRSAIVYRPDGSARLLREHEALDGEAVLPGFSLPLDLLFADP